MTGRCEKFFKNATEFKPERFLKSANSDDSRCVTYKFNLTLREFSLKFIGLLKYR